MENTFKYLLLDGGYTILLLSLQLKMQKVVFWPLLPSTTTLGEKIQSLYSVYRNTVYTPEGFVDSQTSKGASGEIRPSEWRRIVDDVAGMSPIPNVRGSWYSNNPISMREAMKHYVNSEIGSVEWEWVHVRRKFMEIQIKEI